MSTNKYSPFIPISTNTSDKRQTNFTLGILIVTLIRRSSGGMSKGTPLTRTPRSVGTLGDLLLRLDS